MEIRELLLKHYGKFHNHRITLKPGINIIYGGNEAGKSTIHSFIRAMLFGLGRGRGKAARTDEYQIRQPWDMPGAFLGSMKVEEAGKVYRIDRCFDRSASPLGVTCETTGEEIEEPEKIMEYLLGGISESAFVNTVFIPQARCETEEALARELQRYMVNTNSALDAEVDVSRALQSLRKKKKALEQQKKSEDANLEAQISKKQERAEAIRMDLEEMKRQAGDSYYGRNPDGRNAGGRFAGNGEASENGGGVSERRRGGIAAGRSRESTDGQERRSRYESPEGQERRDRRGNTGDSEGRPGRGRLILELLLTIAGILALAGAYFLSQWRVKIFLGVFGVVFLLMLLPVHFLIGGDEEDESYDEEDDEELPGRKETAAGPQEQSWLQRRIRDREEEYRRLQDELEQLYARDVGLEGTETEIAAVSMAIDRICNLSGGIYEKSAGTVNERASGILRELTGGAYTRIRLDETSQVRIHTPSRVLGLHQVSGGTVQQAYFALRMAAGEVLAQGRKLPVILDETFAMYDDARLESALRWLKRSGRQVILFTCQKREREILRQIEAQSNVPAQKG